MRVLTSPYRLCYRLVIMNYAEIGVFLIKTLIIVFSILVVVILPMMVKQFQNEKGKGKKLTVKNLKKNLNSYIQQVQKNLLSKKDLKSYIKSHKKNQKQFSQKTFVLEFNGDKMATQVDALRDEISLLLEIAKPGDEVILNLESPGGAVAHYGLAASQLQRLREKKIPLTICVDKVAASGGYLMACVGNQILSAPFAFIGSIGVLYGLPNLYEFLKKNDITYEEVTAGKFKRTLTPFGKVTDEKRQKLQEQIDLIHNQFQGFLKKFRPNLDFEKVATGEVWLGDQALNLGLVDKIKTSDSYIMDKMETSDVYKINLSKTTSVLDKLSSKILSII